MKRARKRAAMAISRHLTLATVNLSEALLLVEHYYLAVPSRARMSAAKRRISGSCAVRTKRRMSR